MKRLFLFFIIISFTFLSGCGGIIPTSYTITSTAGAGGSVTPNGVISVTEGGNQIFAITPDICYQIDDVLVDGISEGPIAIYTFTDIQENHTIQVSFFVIPGPRVLNTTTGATYTTIQAAIDTSLTGDTLIVCPRTYYENIIFDNKNITLRSTDPLNPSTVAATIIRGTISDSVVKFSGGDTSTLEGFKITNGNAIQGGGIYITNSSSPIVKNNTITGNTASNSGGGICIMMDSSPTITSNTIENNTASYGGGIFVNFSSPTITSNTIVNNTVDYDGGGIYMYANPIIIEDNTITNNTADNYGGGIYAESCAPDITGNTITNNEAEKKGGGIYVEYSSSTISGNTITENTTTYYGGGIFVDNSSPTITGNTIEDNMASYGGGIHVDNSNTTITGNEINGNAANWVGGGIFVSTSSNLLPVDARPTGWGTFRQNIPIGVMVTLIPAEGVEDTIAGNRFLGNEHGAPLGYTEGAHVYFF